MNPYEAPENNYILVMPDGRVVGFEESDMAQAYVNRYYQEQIALYCEKVDFSEFDMTEWKSTVNICRTLGVNEGLCILYRLDELIASIQKSSIFEDEKNYLIANLRGKNINLNINDYQIDDILANVDGVIYQ
ncbi:hypothetical protein QYB59_001009 [Clostridium perfringens]|nr:hypothetical protein [Clostridium perfringens]